MVGTSRSVAFPRSWSRLIARKSGVQGKLSEKGVRERAPAKLWGKRPLAPSLMLSNNTFMLSNNTGLLVWVKTHRPEVF